MAMSSFSLALIVCWAISLTIRLFTVGIRPYIRSKEYLTNVIQSVYYSNTSTSTDKPSQGSDTNVAIFVYMWVNPSYRGKGLGDTLLRLAYRKINQLGK